MRTHGSRRQQDAVRAVPVKQMQKVYEVGGGYLMSFLAFLCICAHCLAVTAR